MRIVKTWHPLVQVRTGVDGKPTGKLRYETPPFEPPEPLAKLSQINYEGYDEAKGPGLWATWEVPTEDPFSIPPARAYATTPPRQRRRRGR